MKQKDMIWKWLIGGGLVCAGVVVAWELMRRGVSWMGDLTENDL